MVDPFANLDWVAISIVAGLIIAAVIGSFVLFTFTQDDRRTGFQLGENLKAERCVVESWSGNEGYVRTGGELWKACSKDDLSPDEPVRVAKKDGLLLEVKRKRQ